MRDKYLVGLLLFLLLILSACSGSNGPVASKPEVKKIETGDATTSMTAQVESNGGVLTINKPGDPLNGLVLTVPSGSYPDARSFTISSAPVTRHTFGPYFNPITPLITVENGGEYSEEIMEVKIPVQVPAGSFAMGFIYDDRTGQLEGLPTVTQDATSITVSTRHFSKIIISYIDEQLLLTDIDTDFYPGKNDWEFTNYGSYIKPRGHCAGQSLTSIWYYYEKPDGDVKLYGLYDNNGKEPPTPQLWQDDSLGYRFASVIQKDMQWDGLLNLITREYLPVDDSLTWKLFAYSMLLTGQPQSVAIYNTTQGGGHAMVVYRIFKGLNSYVFYVADPNYPGDTLRQINYADGKFKPYNSGENAGEIAQGNGKAYDKITYIAKTAVIDWGKIGARWSEFKAGTIGNDSFPAYKIVWKDELNAVHDLVDGLVSATELIDLYPTSTAAAVGLTVYRDGVQLNFDSNGKIKLNPGNNLLGFYIEGTVNNQYKYIDFKYINVVYLDTITLTSKKDSEDSTSITYKVSATLSAVTVPTDVSINVLYGTTDTASSTQSISANGEVSWSVTVPGRDALVTVTRLDTNEQETLILPGKGVRVTIEMHGSDLWHNYELYYDGNGTTMDISSWDKPLDYWIPPGDYVLHGKYVNTDTSVRVEEWVVVPFNVPGTGRVDIYPPNHPPH